MTTITLDGPDRAGNLRRWQALLGEFAPFAHTFQLHCWEDEKETIALAGQHGAEEAASWEHGRVFAGDVTPAFLRMLLQQPLPQDCGEAPKLTPFFSIFLDNGFCSEHYGTEVHIITEEDIP